MTRVATGCRPARRSASVETARSLYRASSMVRGNGRGRGHQQVGGPAFKKQGGPLGHAETVLFVDDHHGQVLENDVFADQGMGAEDQGDVAACAGRAWISFPGFGGRSRR